MASAKNTTSFDSLLRILVILIIPSILIGGVFYIAGQKVSSRSQPYPTITARGEVKLAESPDLAVVTLGVQTERVATAQESMQQLQVAMDAIVKKMGTLSIEKKDMQTSALNLYPAYDWVDGERINRGFEASQNITIKVRDLQNVGKAVSAATSAGANQVSGIQFVIEDVDALRSKARAQAIRRARQEATKLSNELDARLGDLIGFSEDMSTVPTTGYGKGGAMDGGGAVMDSMVIPSGENELTMRVFLTYELY